MGGTHPDYRKRLKRALAWLLSVAAFGPFAVYLLLTVLSHLLDDE